MTGLAQKTPEFDAFVQTATELKGIADIDPEWLLEIWTSADCDLNRALNHVFDTEDSKVRRKFGGSSKPVPLPVDNYPVSSHESTEKKSKKKDKSSRSRRKKESDSFADLSTLGTSDFKTSSSQDWAGAVQEVWEVPHGGDPWTGQQGSDPWTGHQGSDTWTGLAKEEPIKNSNAWEVPEAVVSTETFSGHYLDQGFHYTITQDGSSVTVASNPPRPECPASGRVERDTIQVLGLTGKFSGRAISWSNGMTWKPAKDAGMEFHTADYNVPSHAGFAEDAFNASGSGFHSQSPAWDVGVSKVEDGMKAHRQFAFGSDSGTYQQQSRNQSYVLVDSESDSDNDWWHMPKLRHLLSGGGWQIDQIVGESYHNHFPQGWGGLQELRGLAQDMAKTMGIGAGAFKNLHVMHERFDFSGDGALDVNEAIHLVKACLRGYYHQNDPRSTKVRDIRLPQKNIEDEFSVIKKLGQGGQGSMYLVSVRGRQDELRCIKVYQKANANAPLDGIKEEFELMRRLDSPFVARTFEIFEDRTNVYMVNEPYFGGDLTKLVAHASDAGLTLSEDWFRGVLQQPAQGIVYMNQQHLMHCDLKEANVMIANDSNWQQPHVILIDFGLAKNFVGDTLGVSGTPGYIAPETWQKGYWVPKGDVFSLGVMFFQILSGISQLFAGYMGATKIDDIIRCTCTAEPPWHVFNHQPEFQELVRWMIQKEPLQRVSIFQVVQHSWFRNMTGAPIDPQVIDHIRHFNRKSETEMQLAEIMLDRFNIAGLRHLAQAFLTMDYDHSGVVTAEEARQSISNVSAQLGLTPVEMDQLVTGLADNEGKISYRRFMTALIHQQRGFSAADLWARFCQIDTDRNGVLDQSELFKLVKTMNYTEQDAWALMQTLDRDADGRITFEEFQQAVLGNAVPF